MGIPEHALRPLRGMHRRSGVWKQPARHGHLVMSRARHRGQRGFGFVLPTGRMTVVVRGVQTLIRFLPVIGKGHNFI